MKISFTRRAFFNKFLSRYEDKSKLVVDIWSSIRGELNYVVLVQ